MVYSYDMKDVKNEYLGLVNRVDTTLRTATDLQKATEKVYQELGKLLAVKNFAVALLDRREKTISFQIIVENRKVKKVDPRKFADGLIEHVVISKKPLRINKDLSSFCRKSKFVLSPGLKSAKSWLGVPMIFQSKVLGAVAIYENNESAYSEFDEILLSDIALKLTLIFENARLSEAVKSSSLIDPTTAAANRQYFDLVLEREMKKAIGYTRPLSLVLVEIDDYPNIKKNIGFENADKLLAYVARFIRTNVRDTDFVARFDASYFVMLFPETDNPGAMIVAKRIRSRIEGEKISIKNLRKMSVTVSMGVATYPYHAENVEGLLKTAAKAAKRAKELGKNRVETI